MTSVKSILVIAASVYIFFVNSQSDTSFLVRICISEGEQTNVFCLAVYYLANWVIASEACVVFLQLEVSEISLLIGSPNMDCHSGDKRFLAEWHLAKDDIFNVAVIKINEPFHLAEGFVSMIPLLETLPSGTCRVYCSYKSPQLEALSERMDKAPNCQSRITYYDLTIEECPRGITSPQLMCLGPPVLGSGYSFSPVVCGNKLAGFLVTPIQQRQIIMALVQSIADDIYTQTRDDSVEHKSAAVRTSSIVIWLQLFIYITALVTQYQNATASILLEKR
ncbi:hypothetical protein Trydic_g3591 [Trypoxylus dichotomus]